MFRRHRYAHPDNSTCSISIGSVSRSIMPAWVAASTRSAWGLRTRWPPGRWHFWPALAPQLGQATSRAASSSAVGFDPRLQRGVFSVWGRKIVRGVVLVVNPDILARQAHDVEPVLLFEFAVAGVSGAVLAIPAEFDTTHRGTALLRHRRPPSPAGGRTPALNTATGATRRETPPGGRRRRRSAWS